VSAEPRSLPGVAYGHLHRHPDARGSFAEAWRGIGSPELAAFQGVQANLSSSATGVLRGLHLHRRQSDLWIVLSGVAFVVLVDVRPMLDDPKARPLIATSTLSPDDTVTIPPLIAHGFLAIKPLELLYLVTNEYDGTDELGFKWDDPNVNVNWPAVDTRDRRPVLSERDQESPALADLVERLRSNRLAG
jgi:dTDP-4-dehydrorhamnose 3,5-epimerase